MHPLTIGAYVKQHQSEILEAGLKGFQEQGRGALLVFPQQNNGKGKTSVRYLTEQMVTEDNDPSVTVVKRYDPNREAIIIVAMDSPKQILVYTVDQSECRLNLALSDGVL